MVKSIYRLIKDQMNTLLLISFGQIGAELLFVLSRVGKKLFSLW